MRSTGRSVLPTGYVPPEAAASAWAEAVGRVLRDDAGVRQRRRLRAAFSWEAIAATVLEPLLVEAARSAVR